MKLMVMMVKNYKGDGGTDRDGDVDDDDDNDDAGEDDE